MNIVLISLGILCIPLDAWIWFKGRTGKLNEIAIHSTLIIIIPIINWFAFAAYRTGLIVSPTSGFYEGDLNIIGLAIAILPPLIIFICGYIIAAIMYKIKWVQAGKQMQKNREEYYRKKEGK